MNGDEAYTPEEGTREQLHDLFAQDLESVRTAGLGEVGGKVLRWFLRKPVPLIGKAIDHGAGHHLVEDAIHRMPGSAVALLGERSLKQYWLFRKDMFQHLPTNEFGALGRVNGQGLQPKDIQNALSGMLVPS